MKKVLYIFDSLKRGGAETSTLEIARNFEKWKPVVVVIYEGTELQKEFEEAGIKVYSLNFSSQWKIFAILKKLRSIIDFEKPKIIHSNLFMADQFARILGPKNNVPVVNSFVNDSYSNERKEMLSIKGRLVLAFYQTLDRLTASRVSAFISLTHAIIPNNAKALKIDANKVKVIPRGRNITSFRDKVNQEKVNYLKEEFGPGPILITVSRLLIRKGYIEAIKAMRQVVDKYPKVHYLIIGWGHDEELLKNLIEELNMEKNISLLGNRTDIPSLLAAADIFLFPSHYEGQGGALIEAMIMGKKIIASKIAVLEETVKEDHSAKLFEYRNINDLARKIVWAIENPQMMEKLGARARVESEKFDIENVVKLHETLYNRIVKNNYK